MWSKSLIILLMLLAASCAFIHHKEQVPAAKLTSDDSGKMSVLLKDGTVLNLRDARVYSDFIAGRGYKYSTDTTFEPFSGQIQTDDIVLVQTLKPEWFGSMLTLASVGVLLGFTIDASNDGYDNPFQLRFYYPSGGSGGGYWGSCPFVCSWDGKQYHFEAECFAGAICRSLEYAALEPLRKLEEVDGG
jgi:hypothetical protein